MATNSLHSHHGWGAPFSLAGPGGQESLEEVMPEPFFNWPGSLTSCLSEP